MRTKRHSSALRGRALLAPLTVAVLALTACTGGSGGDTTSASGPASGTSAPGNVNTSGKITLGTLFAPGSLDPATSTKGTDFPYLYLVFDRLIQRDPKTAALKPMLATSWKFIGPKKLELKVTLRKGVKFQDGTPFNSAAVVTFSKRYLKSGDASNNLQYVTDVTTQGPYTVIYHLSQQNAQLPSGLADRAGMIPSPSAVSKEGKGFATHPVGTGPYEFGSAVQGASYKFSRFDDYWNDSALPRVQDLEFKVFQSDTSLVNAVRSGVVNVAAGVSSQDVGQLKSNSKLDVAVGQDIRFNGVYFNGSREPLNHREIRLAFNLALNRKAIMEAATNGLGQVWTEGQPPGTFGYVKSLDPLWPYDPKRAKALVKQAGYPNGVDLTCYQFSGLGYEITAPIIIAEEKAVGINLKLVPGGAAQVAPFFTNHAGPQCLMASGSGQGNPFRSYLGLWSKAYYNAGKTDFGVDKYYAELFKTYDHSKQQQLYYDINKVETTNPGYAILYAPPSINVYQKNIGGWRVSPLPLYDNWRGMYYES